MNTDLTDDLLQPIIIDDLTPIEVPVTIKGDAYVLVEASEAAAVVYRNSHLKGIKLHNGKPSGFEGLAESDSLLLSQCLYKINGTTRQIVSQKEIQAWPHRVSKQLVERCKRLSRLEDKQPKKPVIAGKDTSD